GVVCAGLCVVVVRRQDRLMAFLVDLGGGAFGVLFFFVAVDRLVGDLIFGLLVVSGEAGAATRATAADGFFHRVELGVALGATSRATVQIVEFGLAVRADLLLAQFGIGHVIRPSAGLRGKSEIGRLPCHWRGPLSKAFFSARFAALLRSEEHTSELQSRENLVCRLLLEKKKKTTPRPCGTRET